MVSKYSPFEEMNRMFEQMRSSFGEFEDALEHVRLPERTGLAPSTNGQLALDLTERDGAYVLSADLPGFETDEITLSFADGTLTITANHEVDEDGHARSRSVFERVSIPAMVDEDDIGATYRNGVLTVTMPTLDTARPDGRTIEIED